jgi:L-fuculose-phosphate aldolase
MTDLELRDTLVRVGRALVDSGLTRGTSGNVSVRTAGGMLITPSGVPWSQIAPEMMVELPLDADDEVAAATTLSGFRPSTEWRLHASILRSHPDCGAVVHAHPPFATALSCLRRSIPPFHYMVAVAGSHEIPCAPYATFGTRELAESVEATLGPARACLMANHGMVALGSTADGALALAVEVEALAEQYWRALQVGEPSLLGPDEMQRVTRAFERYKARG